MHKDAHRGKVSGHGVGVGRLKAMGSLSGWGGGEARPLRQLTREIKD